VLKRVVVELPKCARVRDVYEPGKTSSAEIAAIRAALEYAQENLQPLSQLATLDPVVFSDSHQALRAI
jgi:hypothetical protein